jgi:quercetin dioxygenase-like cupin family protein
MSIVDGPRYEPMVGDPDDHRPESRWALLVDPGDENGRVDTLALIDEQIAPGDAIPLHTHDVDESIAILDGEADARLGDERRRIGPGAVAFIPAGTPHGTINAGDGPVHILAAFPATSIVISMLERNPAPGTEDDRPRSSRYDLRTGDVQPLD